MIQATQQAALMDRVYRHQRHIYDATRKYYLLGRDRLIAGLAPPQGGTILEVGCGTGRNLMAIQRRYPDAKCFGLDISQAMLDAATVASRRAGLADRIAFVQGDATAFDPVALFGTAHFDRVVMSYTLSMVPDWRAALAQALAVTAPGGRLAIVDFGRGQALPRPVLVLLDWWLGEFHVARRRDLGAEMAALAARHGREIGFQEFYFGYAALAQIRR